MNITLNDDQMKALVEGANSLKNIERNIREGIFDFYFSDLTKIMSLQHEIASILELKNDDFYEEYKLPENKKK